MNSRKRSKRMNFPGRLNQRRKNALAYLEGRLEASDETLFQTMKKFKNFLLEDLETYRKDIDNHRKYLKREIQNVSKKIMNEASL